MAENMSFLPEDYVEKRLARRTNVICLTLFAIVAVGLWATYFVDLARRDEARSRLAEANEQFERAAQQIQQFEELQARKDEWTRKAQVAAVLVERVHRTILLSELINHMPQSLGLLEFTLETETIKTSAPPASKLQLERAKKSAKAAAKKVEEPVIDAPKMKVKMDLTGVAPTDVEIAEYITALSSHPLFREVSLKFSEQSKVEDREMRKFGLSMVLNTDLDMRQIEPLKVARDLKMNPMGTKVQISPDVPVSPVMNSD